MKMAAVVFQRGSCAVASPALQRVSLSCKRLSFTTSQLIRRQSQKGPCIGLE